MNLYRYIISYLYTYQLYLMRNSPQYLLRMTTMYSTALLLKTKI